VLDEDRAAGGSGVGWPRDDAADGGYGKGARVCERNVTAAETLSRSFSAFGLQNSGEKGCFERQNIAFPERKGRLCGTRGVAGARGISCE
jgi:hypothetical protein